MFRKLHIHMTMFSTLLQTLFLFIMPSSLQKSQHHQRVALQYLPIHSAMLSSGKSERPVSPMDPAGRKQLRHRYADL